MLNNSFSSKSPSLKGWNFLDAIKIWAPILLIGLCFCATVPKPPDWIAGKSSAYPSGKYLIGIGQAQASGKPADDQASADQNARAEIARQIKTRIQSQLYTQAEEELQRLGPDEQRRFSQRIKTEVSASAILELEGMELAERYYDEQAGVYYALAVLDRKKTGDLLISRIKELEMEIAGLLELKDQNLAGKEPLKALNYLVRAENSIRKEIGIRSQYLVVSGKALESKYHLADLLKEDEQIKNSTQIMVIAFEQAPGQKSSGIIESYLISGLSGLGFDLVSAPAELRAKGAETIKELAISNQLKLESPSNYLVLGNFQTKKTSETRIGSHLYYFYKTGGEIHLIDLPNGKIVLSMIDLSPEATKAGKPKPDQAISLSLEQAGKYFSGLWMEILNQRFLKPESK